MSKELELFSRAGEEYLHALDVMHGEATGLRRWLLGLRKRLANWAVMGPVNQQIQIGQADEERREAEFLKNIDSAKMILSKFLKSREIRTTGSIFDAIEEFCNKNHGFVHYPNTVSKTVERTDVHTVDIAFEGLTDFISLHISGGEVIVRIIGRTIVPESTVKPTEEGHRLHGATIFRRTTE